jgi:hypothetical protein
MTNDPYLDRKFYLATLAVRCDCDVAKERVVEVALERAEASRKAGIPPLKHYQWGKAPGNDYFAAVLASLAYKMQPGIETELVDLGYVLPRVWFVRSKLASAFITEWDDTIVVVFKGSSTLREWISNLNIWLKRTPYGRVHAGFYNALNEIFPQLLFFSLPDCSRDRR